MSFTSDRYEQESPLPDEIVLPKKRDIKAKKSRKSSESSSGYKPSSKNSKA